MPAYCCCISGCDNDSRYPEKQEKFGHVDLFPQDPDKRVQCVKNVSKGLNRFEVIDHKTVDTNHSKYESPMFASPAPTF